MTAGRRSACALTSGVSIMTLAIAVAVPPAHAQGEPADESLDPVTVVATKTKERVSRTLAPVSTARSAPAQRPPAPPSPPPARRTAAAPPPAPPSPALVGSSQIQQLAPTRTSDVFFGMPGVATQERPDDPGTAINIRGLQDFGRVAVVIDGARQNFQRTRHNADGIFYLDPEMIGGADVVRGPVANIYGSGAIGGVAAFRTKDVEDVLKAGERWGVLTHGMLSSNVGISGSAFGAVRISPDAELFMGGGGRTQGDYKDANGNVIPNTHSDVDTGTLKGTFRPADGHQIKLGLIEYDATYNTGQPFPPGTPPPLASIYGTHTENQIANGRWTYSKPDDQLLDFDGNVYWTRTSTDQTKIAGTPAVDTGLLGAKRNFTINTYGFDAHNTSRFDVGPTRNALTYGGDSFHDQVDTAGFNTVFTPSGERTVSGAFVQLKSNYASLLEVVGALRHDRYALEGGGLTASGDRVSPKITVGVTPVDGFTPYVTYAEGYRAPAVTETLVAGIHPATPQFTFLPNPQLKPEVGKNREIGLNLRYDNVLAPGDAFRVRFNVYRNDIEDYIDLKFLGPLQTGGGQTCLNFVAFFCEQYQNIARARIEGVELDTTYDAGSWFAGLAGSHIRGRDLINRLPLARIPPDQITTTLGARFMDRKLTVAVRWQTVAAKDPNDIPPGPEAAPGATKGPPFYFFPTAAYNLVNVYVGYQINPDTLASLAVENLFNQQYARYLYVTPSPNHGPGSTPLPFYSPGLTVKGSLTIRFTDQNLGKG
jgi:hemoglobin/transferrin/lactoferrin receptor protein